MIETEDAARHYVQSRWGERAAAECEILAERLHHENVVQNLVSKTSLDHIWVRHIADSAQLLEHALQNTSSWIDVGTGAGFPGLIVSILHREWKVTLVEPRRLRVAWLQTICAELQLNNCAVVQAKAEQCQVAAHDAISARAVSGLADLLAMTRKMGHAHSRWIFAKGQNALEELEALPKSLTHQFMFHVKHSLTAPNAYIIVAERSKDPS
jgi:16S rRNA (guanine527-N7)-methyltransferase